MTTCERRHEMTCQDCDEPLDSESAWYGDYGGVFCHDCYWDRHIRCSGCLRVYPVKTAGWYTPTDWYCIECGRPHDHERNNE